MLNLTLKPSCLRCASHGITAYHDDENCPVLKNPEQFQQATIADVRRIVQEELANVMGEGLNETRLSQLGIIPTMTPSQAADFLGVELLDKPLPPDPPAEPPGWTAR